MEKRNIFNSIYQIVKRIPKGRVATYGQVAGLMGELKKRGVKERKKVDARIVGWALHANTDRAWPCHRVVDRNGRVAENYAFPSKGRSASGCGGWKKQKKKLEKEEVGFKDKLHVDLEKYLWKNPES